jgi:hypothetical protein
MSWYWVGRVDAAIAGLAPAFCNLSLTNAAGHYTNAAPPMLTFTGVLDQAGITNASGYPVFRRDQTNATIWPRLADLRQRRDALAGLRWTRKAWDVNDARTAGETKLWIGSTSAPSSVAWSVLEQAASNRYALSGSGGSYYAARYTKRSIDSGNRTAEVRREASRFDLECPAAWSNWTRSVDVYLETSTYLYDHEETFSGDQFTEVEYYGDNANSDMLPVWTQTTNYYWRARSPDWHRTYNAASGTVWTSFWIGDTNGTMPTAWASRYPAPYTGTNSVLHEYRYTNSGNDEVEELSAFTHYIVLKWEARYP